MTNVTQVVVGDGFSGTWVTVFLDGNVDVETALELTAQAARTVSGSAVVDVRAVRS